MYAYCLLLQYITRFSMGIAIISSFLYLVSIEPAQFDIKSMIYVVRNQQVMIDSDLAMLYQVETKRLNEAVKRNIARFPDSMSQHPHIRLSE